MYEFKNAISVNGLGDDIFSSLMKNAQEKIMEKILTAARNGQTSCVVKQKGITPVFLSQLEQEGVSNIIKDEEECVLLFWEW
ncbi:hypothetical protein P7D31_09870 [Enterococcus dongliensis]|uniref:hypothetical protein n=1 Tax=Enterococcus dongliensis TaxID=2559925 RepID=UPI00288F1695|nr:hypothetical protein [Enterococcus dongliensis]MDT2640422.1 hypothetical protein [Enterococcus dongliensis]